MDTIVALLSLLAAVLEVVAAVISVLPALRDLRHEKENDRQH